MMNVASMLAGTRTEFLGLLDDVAHDRRGTQGGDRTSMFRPTNDPFHLGRYEE